MHRARAIASDVVVCAAIAIALAACSSSGTTSRATTPKTDASLSPTGPTGAAPSSSPPATVATGATATGAADVNAAGDIPDNQAYIPYTPPAGGWTVTVPAGWARSTTTDAVTFTDKFNSITLSTSTSGAAPTPAGATSGELPALAQQKGYHAGNITVVKRKAGDVLAITYQLDSPVNAVTGKFVALAVERYEYWKAGMTVAITLSAPVGSDNVDPWRTVTDSFAWK